MTPGDVLDELIAGNCDPLSRRRVEAMVLGMPPGDLEGLFLALPVLDGIVRHEIHERAQRTS